MENNNISDDISTICIAYNLRKLSRQINKFYNEKISQSGLQGTQFPLLLAIKQNQPITITKLADILDIDRTTLSRSLKLMEKKGYIFFGLQKGDNRLKNIALTAQGLSLIDQALPYWQEAQNEMEEIIGTKQWTEMLKKINQILKIIS